MRARLGLVVAAATSVALVACIDLFHGTDDIVNGCAIDASLDGCGPDAAAVPDAGDADAPDTAPPVTDLCAPTPAIARARADAACKWLAACETPLGRNRYGACMALALQAYDCAIHPGRLPQAAARDFWVCLANADTCGKVERCVYPRVIESCPANVSGFTACQLNTSDGNPGVRSYCPVASAPAPGEPCLVAGQRCVAASNAAFCGGEAIDGGCTPGCFGTALHDCDDAGVNVGVDCALFGAGRCATAGGLSACAAKAGTPCTPTDAITCNNGVASGCPSGVVETVDCAALTGVAVTQSCDPNAPGRPWDVSRACFDSTGVQTCTDGVDACQGARLTSCYGGVPYTTTCGPPFTGCAMTSTIDGTGARCSGVPGAH